MNLFSPPPLSSFRSRVKKRKAAHISRIKKEGRKKKKPHSLTLAHLAEKNADLLEVRRSNGRLINLSRFNLLTTLSPATPFNSLMTLLSVRLSRSELRYDLIKGLHMFKAGRLPSSSSSSEWWCLTSPASSPVKNVSSRCTVPTSSTLWCHFCWDTLCFHEQENKKLEKTTVRKNDKTINRKYYQTWFLKSRLSGSSQLDPAVRVLLALACTADKSLAEYNPDNGLDSLSLCRYSLL